MIKSIFRRRFNWFDMLYILGAPYLFAEIGWWSVAIILAGAVFSVQMENAYENS